MIKQLYARDLQDFLLQNSESLLLDVRQQFEFDEVSLKNALLIPLGELPIRVSEIIGYKNKHVIVYCKAGVRSMVACQILESEGFTSLHNLTEGISAFY